MVDVSRKGVDAQDRGCYVAEPSGRRRKDLYWWANRFETASIAIVEEPGVKVNWPAVVRRFDINQLGLESCWRRVWTIETGP